jgi:hypothetical protein
LAAPELISEIAIPEAPDRLQSFATSARRYTLLTNGPTSARLNIAILAEGFHGRPGDTFNQPTRASSSTSSLPSPLTRSTEIISTASPFLSRRFNPVRTILPAAPIGTTYFNSKLRHRRPHSPDHHSAEQF